jgi:hypothetical protein
LEGQAPALSATVTTPRGLALDALMTINPFFIGIPALVVFVMAGYLLREFSTRKLTAEELGSLDKGLQLSTPIEN